MSSRSSVIAASLVTEVADEKPANRRRSERKPYVVEAWISSPTSKNPADRMEVVGVNVSRHGVAFDLPKPIATGAYFIFQVGFGPQKLRSEVRILSCKKHNDHYRIGATFC